MEMLKKSFSLKGIDYNQYTRSKEICMYEVSHAGNALYYEVFQIPISHKKSAKGESGESKEDYSKVRFDNEKGYLIKSQLTAIKKFYEMLEENEKNRNS